jgi:hypothetical protein
LYEDIAVRIHRKKASRTKAWHQYKTFCEINDLKLGSNKSFALVASSMMCSNLKTTTINERLGLMEEGLHDALRTEKLDEDDREFVSRRDLKDYVAFEAAKLKPRHARDHARKKLIQEIIQQPPGGMRFATACILQTGIRCADFEYLSVEQIYITSQSISVEVRVAKNRRKTGEITTVTINDTMSLWSPELIGVLLEDYPLMTHGKRSTDQLFAVSSGEMIRAMKQWNVPNATTYTLRRSYVHAVIAFATVNGVTNWQVVTQFTLHFDEKTVKSAYALHASDMHLRAEEEESE